MKKCLSITLVVLMMLSASVIGISAAEKDNAATGDDSYTISGTITSFLSEEDDVTIAIKGSVLSIKKKGNSIKIKYDNIPAGKYTISISKKNHVTREYEIDLNKDIDIDAVICPIGDVTMDGEVTTMDVTRANAYVKGKAPLEGYALQCADVLDNTEGVTTMDVTRINSHVQKVKPLW